MNLTSWKMVVTKMHMIQGKLDCIGWQSSWFGKKCLLWRKQTQQLKLKKKIQRSIPILAPNIPKGINPNDLFVVSLLLVFIDHELIMILDKLWIKKNHCRVKIINNYYMFAKSLCIIFYFSAAATSGVVGFIYSSFWTVWWDTSLIAISTHSLMSSIMGGIKLFYVLIYWSGHPQH